MASATVDDIRTADHHDPERKSVPTTAIVVAAFRALETLKGDNALVQDPYALKLASFPQSPSDPTSFLLQFLDGIDIITLDKTKIADLTRAMAVRTKFFDDICETAVESHRISQIVNLAAGLDTRPFRLHKLKTATFFEVDFPNVLAYKAKVLASAQAKLLCHKHAFVGADLSGPWLNELQKAGFNPKLPTLWIVEGLLGYLTEKEVRTLFQSIQNASPEGSHIAGTTGAGSANNTLLRSRIENIVPLLTEYGWSQTTRQTLQEIGSRPLFAPFGDQHPKYYVFTASIPLRRSRLLAFSFFLRLRGSPERFK